MAATEQEKKKLQVLLELGEAAHQLIRAGLLDNQELAALSRQIVELDKEINAPLGQRVPSKDDGKCPRCGAEYGNAVFCGACGQNISEFFDSPIPACSVCGFRVGEEDKFCGVCGTKREG